MTTTTTTRPRPQYLNNVRTDNLEVSIRTANACSRADILTLGDAWDRGLDGLLQAVGTRGTEELLREIATAMAARRK